MHRQCNGSTHASSFGGGWRSTDEGVAAWPDGTAAWAPCSVALRLWRNKDFMVLADKKDVGPEAAEEIQSKWRRLLIEYMRRAWEQQKEEDQQAKKMLEMQPAEEDRRRRVKKRVVVVVAE